MKTEQFRIYRFVKWPRISLSNTLLLYCTLNLYLIIKTQSEINIKEYVLNYNDSYTIQCIQLAN